MLTGNLYAVLVITLRASIHALNFNMNSLDTNHNCSYYKFCGCLNYLQKRDSQYSCHWFLWSLRAIHLSMRKEFLKLLSCIFLRRYCDTKIRAVIWNQLSFNHYARQRHITPSQASLHKLVFKLQFRNGFIPEHFLTAKIEIKKRFKSYRKPAQILIFNPISFLLLPHLQLWWTPSILSKRLDPYLWFVQEVRGKNCFHKIEWRNGCLQDTHILFVISYWHKSSKAFSLHQELHFWKKIWWINGQRMDLQCSLLKNPSNILWWSKPTDSLTWQDGYLSFSI